VYSFIVSILLVSRALTSLIRNSPSCSVRYGLNPGADFIAVLHQYPIGSTTPHTSRAKQLDKLEAPARREDPPSRHRSINPPTVTLSRSTPCITKAFCVRNSKDFMIRMVRVAEVSGRREVARGWWALSGFGLKPGWAGKRGGGGGKGRGAGKGGGGAETRSPKVIAEEDVMSVVYWDRMKAGSEDDRFSSRTG